MELINKLEIDKEIFNLISNCLKFNEKFSFKKELEYLVREKVITKDLSQTCLELRNNSAHADKTIMDKNNMQELINKTNACLELFYLLLFSHIKYTGEYIQYSKEKWPVHLIIAPFE